MLTSSRPTMTSSISIVSFDFSFSRRAALPLAASSWLSNSAILPPSLCLYKHMHTTGYYHFIWLRFIGDNIQSTGHRKLFSIQLCNNGTHIFWSSVLCLRFETNGNVCRVKVPVLWLLLFVKVGAQKVTRFIFILCTAYCVRRGSVVSASVSGWRTFPDMRLIYGWRVTTSWVRRPLWVNQPRQLSLLPSVGWGMSSISVARWVKLLAAVSP